MTVGDRDKGEDRLFARYLAAGVPEFRARIAARQNAEYYRAVADCGRGATAYAKVAVEDSCGLEPSAVCYVCRRPEWIGWRPDVECDVRAPENQVPPGPWKSPMMAFGFTVTKDFHGLVAGHTYRVCRRSYRLSAVERYEPRTFEQLQAAKEKREARRVAREMAAAPLFAAQIREEVYGAAVAPDEKPVKVRGDER